MTQDRTLDPALPSRGGTREFPIQQRVWALDHLALSMLSRKADGEDERGNQKGVGFMLLALIIKQFIFIINQYQFITYVLYISVRWLSSSAAATAAVGLLVGSFCYDALTMQQQMHRYIINASTTTQQMHQCIYYVRPYIYYKVNSSTIKKQIHLLQYMYEIVDASTI